MSDDDKINPPLIGVKPENVLCPPLNVDDYMQWLRANKQALREFFGFEEGDDEMG